MNKAFYNKVAEESIAFTVPAPATCRTILESSEIELLPLLDAAYQVRKKFTGKEVSIHIINNAQNGYCPEDCHYCAQAKTSQSEIDEYPLKPDEEILAEAKNAHEKGAFRYCMVFAGRGPSQRRTEHLASLIKKIKATYPIEVCVSTGILNQEKAQILKDAGLDRLNHNLNTSESNYPNICTTHTFADRLNTLKAARNVGMEVCSGIIIGMGESIADIVEVATTLREIKARSIPINLFMPIAGNTLKQTTPLTPEFCLRVLCLFRFLNPDAEIRVAAGREMHLRSMEVMALYPANSLFLDGYLNTKGSNSAKTLRMIKDAGFTIKSEQNLDELLEQAEKLLPGQIQNVPLEMKQFQDLRPHFQRQSK